MKFLPAIRAEIKASDALTFSTTAYALLRLHEAIGATGDEKLRAAENKLTEFLCRIQARSENFLYPMGLEN